MEHTKPSFQIFDHHQWMERVSIVVNPDIRRQYIRFALLAFATGHKVNHHGQVVRS